MRAQQLVLWRKSEGSAGRSMSVRLLKNLLIETMMRSPPTRGVLHGLRQRLL